MTKLNKMNRLKNFLKYWSRPYSQRQYDKIKSGVDKVNADNERVNKGKKK
tara:strand:- start:120 stop:269 length:150 start_codon:yes stop_codon:yes gene_type:complete